MSIDQLREAIRPKLHLFEDMLANPIQFESDHPDMTIGEIIELYESFYLLEPIGEKWVGGARGSACVPNSCLQLCVDTVC